jgi:hypothetical protein
VILVLSSPGAPSANVKSPAVRQVKAIQIAVVPTGGASSSTFCEPMPVAVTGGQSSVTASPPGFLVDILIA